MTGSKERPRNAADTRPGGHPCYIDPNCPDCDTPLVLLISGGHTMVVAHSDGVWRVLGETLDLTLGQLLDQLGRYAGFSSPCGRKIEEAASKSRRFPANRDIIRPSLIFVRISNSKP